MTKDKDFGTMDNIERLVHLIDRKREITRIMKRVGILLAHSEKADTTVTLCADNEFLQVQEPELFKKLLVLVFEHYSEQLPTINTLIGLADKAVEKEMGTSLARALAKLDVFSSEK